jgi:tetratricopeptide (TPR) repeat protein
MRGKIAAFAIASLWIASCTSSADPTITLTVLSTQTPTLTPAPSTTPIASPIATVTPDLNLAFSLDREIVNVFWHDDGTLSIAYEFQFTNDLSGDPIDFVDVHVPSLNYDIDDFTAEVDGIGIAHIQESTFFPGAIELGLGQDAIQPGESGIVTVQMATLNDVLYLDPDTPENVNAIFFPTWFGEDFILGSTAMSVTFHLPPNAQDSDIFWHHSPSGWPSEPTIGTDFEGRVTLAWSNNDALGHTINLFGASFPAALIPERAIAQPEQLDPKYAEVFNARASSFFFDQEYEMAIAYFSHAIYLNPLYVEAFDGRGGAYIYAGLPQQAIQDASRAIELDPEYPSSYNTLGMAYYNLGDINNALSAYNLAIDLDPQFALAYSNRGLAYANVGQLSQAISDFKKAVELNPELFAVYINIGLLYFNMGDHENAIANYDLAIEFNPEEPLAYSNRGLAYAMLEQYDLALNDLNRAIEISPQFSLAFHNRGLTYLLMMRYEEALDDLDYANQLDPMFANTYYIRGFLYYEIGEVELAIADLEMALELGLDPGSQEIAEELLDELR